MDPWIEDGVREFEVVAHRGYAWRYPENTRLALEQAVEASARYLEFDVHLTRDRVPVLIHDRDLVRTAGRDELVAEIDSSELASFSVHEPARLGERFAGEPIPRLERIVSWLEPLRGVHAFVELKRNALSLWGADEVVPRVVDLLAPISERSTMISFDAPAVARARELGVRSIGWVIETWGDAALASARELEPEFLFLNHEKIPAGRRLWPGPWRWVVYEVVDVEQARALVARGADLIETMRVAEMITALAGSPAGNGE